MMKSFNLIKLAAVSTFGLAAILGTGVMASAQDNRGFDQGQRRTISRQEGDREQRQAGENRRDTRRGDDRWYGNDRDRADRDGAYYNNDRDRNNWNGDRDGRDGSYYNNDQRGDDHRNRYDSRDEGSRNRRHDR